jgi:hypothetical protein
VVNMRAQMQVRKVALQPCGSSHASVVLMRGHATASLKIVAVMWMIWWLIWCR